MRHLRNAIRPVEFIDCTTRDQLALQDTLELVHLEWQKATRNKWNARAANLEMLYKTWWSLKARFFMTDLSYTLFLNCKLIDLECDLPEDAIEWGERQLAQECEDSGETSGTWDVELITRQWDDDLGWQEVERKPVTLYYEEGRSDRDEHFNEEDYL